MFHKKTNYNVGFIIIIINPIVGIVSCTEQNVETGFLLSQLCVTSHGGSPRQYELLTIMYGREGGL